jgi:hypothetical protein
MLLHVVFNNNTKQITGEFFYGMDIMHYLKINFDELSALNGLPYIQQLLYIRGLRPYMDYETGIVGIKRGVSYQSLSEILYIEPHSGISSGSPSKDQIRRAIKGLERAGLLQAESLDTKLIFRCILVGLDYSVQNKPAINPPQEAAIDKDSYKSLLSRDSEYFEDKLASVKTGKPATPLLKDKYIIFLLKQFEIFWSIYPIKKSRQKAWEQFERLQPTPELTSTILQALEAQIQIQNQHVACGIWVAPWKYPANWLAQGCWEDEINLNQIQENQHAVNKRNNAKNQSGDSFWDSCKGGIDDTPDFSTNVLEFTG